MLNYLKKINLERIGLIFCILANCLFILNAYLNYLKSFNIKGVLLQPFSIHKNDFFMDYFNVNYHALTDGFYENYKSVYSGLFRIISNLLTSNECEEVTSSLLLRDCDSNFFIFIFALTISIVLILYKIAVNYKLKYYWIVYFITSFPFLYMLERGNYLIISVALIGIMAHTENQKKFNAILAILPFTKTYFLFNYLVYLKQGIKPTIFFSILFLLIHFILTLTFADGFLDQFKNLLGFSTKAYNIMELLVATTVRPMAYYSENIFLIYISKFIVFCIFIRLYAYLMIFLRIDFNLFNYKYLMLILIIFLMIVIDAIGFYGIVLLYPLFLYFISRDIFSIHEKIIILLIGLPYPFDIFKLGENHGITYFFQLQSLIVPFMLIMLFLSLTKGLRYNEN